MSVRVLIVDDSSFFRRQIQKLLESDKDIEIAGIARDGKEAIEQTLALKPDVITMDIEMPVMDGIQATKEIMRQCPTPVLMFSSLTTQGAKSTLEALDAGALDFIPKRFEDISKNIEEVKRNLCTKVREIGRSRNSSRSFPKSGSVHSTVSVPGTSRKTNSGLAASPTTLKKGTVHLVAIGTSTGGPVALQEVLTHLPSTLNVPLLLIQHMPGTFTPTFAARLDQICDIRVKEAEDGDVLKPGTAYLAPGGKQMTVQKRGSETRLCIRESAPSDNYKPCIDITYKSIAELCKADVVAIILTGMGHDGCEGAKELKRKGAVVWAQDKETSIIYGMPAAVADAGIADKILPLHRISSAIIEQI